MLLSEAKEILKKHGFVCESRKIWHGTGCGAWSETIYDKES